MLDTLLGKQTAQFFRCIDIDGTNQYRLTLFMSLLDSLHNGMEFFFLCLINSILLIDSGDWPVGRDLYNVHAINITELLLFCQGSTGHTCLLMELVKEVLEGNGRQCLAFSLDLYMLLGFNRLMKTVRITTPRHDTTGKFINDQYLIILDHVVLVTEHQVVGTQCKDNIMLDFRVFRISQVLDLEETLYLGNTLGCQVHDLVLFIDNKVARLFSFNAHDGIHLGQVFHIFTTLHLPGEDITDLIKLG